MRNAGRFTPLAVLVIAATTVLTDAPAFSALNGSVAADLDQAVYRPGDAQRLVVTETIDGRRSFDVQDSNGAEWTMIAKDAGSATFTAVAPDRDGVVTVTVTRRSDGSKLRDQATYRVSQWPGHRPGRLILGMSCPAPCAPLEAELAQPYGVRRQFEAWGAWDEVAADLDREHAAGRLPWVSIKGPGGGAAGWNALATGQYDGAIRSLAATLKGHDDQPVIVTFHHEPSNDAPEAAGVDWARAYARFHDVLAAEGALVNVAMAPIVGDWLFNPRNADQDPANWIKRSVLARSAFMGIDLYENSSGETFAERVPRVLSYLAAQGFPSLQVGIGEFAGTDARYSGKNAVQFIDESLAWATQNTDKIAVASYFNSVANSRDGVYWPLNESAEKLATFRAWLDHRLVN